MSMSTTTYRECKFFVVPLHGTIDREAYDAREATRQAERDAMTAEKKAAEEAKILALFKAADLFKAAGLLKDDGL